MARARNHKTPAEYAADNVAYAQVVLANPGAHPSITRRWAVDVMKAAQDAQEQPMLRTGLKNVL